MEGIKRKVLQTQIRILAVRAKDVKKFRNFSKTSKYSYKNKSECFLFLYFFVRQFFQQNDAQFFHHSIQPGPLTSDQWVKIFLILVKISLSYSKFSVKKLTPCSIIMWGVKNFPKPFFFFKKKQNVVFFSRIRIHISFCGNVPLKGCAKVLRSGCWLPGVMSDSPQYYTAGSLTLHSMILRGDWLCAVSYPGEIQKEIWITQQNRNQNHKYFKPLVSSPGRFEWWKTLEVENLVGLSL